MKTCCRCLRTLDSSCFVKSAKYLDGLIQPCKECRKEKQKLRLEENPTCIMCKKEPHMKGNFYCRICLRIINDLPVERKRPNVDRNNKTMCCGCKVNPRKKGGHYCKQCDRALHKKWRQTNGRDYLDRGDNRMKHNARQFVRWKVSKGELIKTPCIVCGNPKVEPHHHKGYDDAHRLDVVWLCKEHHLEAERAKKRLTI